MKAVLFDGDDRAYLRWLDANHDGYVVNLRRHVNSRYVVLHRARCHTVRQHGGMEESPGGFTERSYRKLCGAELPSVIDWLRKEFGTPDPVTKNCARCKPR
jgi:hypothetical protein